MSVHILSNCGSDNHHKFLVDYSRKADRMIIVSPFLTEDMPKILSEMPTINNIEIYTNLDGYNMAIAILDAIQRVYKYCDGKQISVSVKYNNNLHGKVYLLYKGMESKGCIITSGNFTNNGLKNNHEYGVFLDDEFLQKKLEKQIYSLGYFELTYKEVLALNAKAEEFTKKNSIEKQPVFKAMNYIKKNIVLSEKCKCFLKPLGNENRPIEQGYPIIEEKYIGFSKKPSKIAKGDILICYGLGVNNVLGCWKVLEDDPCNMKCFEGDRWNWKFATECITEIYSSYWWEHNIKMSNLVNEYNGMKNQGWHITAAGGDTIGAIKYGSPFIEITKEFAKFIINNIQMCLIADSINEKEYKSNMKGIEDKL